MTNQSKEAELLSRSMVVVRSIIKLLSPRDKRAWKAYFLDWKFPGSDFIHFWRHCILDIAFTSQRPSPNCGYLSVSNRHPTKTSIGRCWPPLHCDRMDTRAKLGPSIGWRTLSGGRPLASKKLTIRQLAGGPNGGFKLTQCNLDYWPGERCVLVHTSTFANCVAKEGPSSKWVPMWCRSICLPDIDPIAYHLRVLWLANHSQHQPTIHSKDIMHATCCCTSLP